MVTRRTQPSKPSASGSSALQRRRLRLAVLADLAVLLARGMATATRERT